MNKLMILAPLALLTACASSPYAIIDGSQSDITDANNHDVVVTGIDGQMYFENLKIRNVEPGPHYIQLASTKVDRQGVPTYNTFTFYAKPCTRYLVSAQHESTLPFDTRDWATKVIREEPVAGCKAEETVASLSIASRK